MKTKDIISALLGLLIMVVTYWVLFYQLAPTGHKKARTYSSLPHYKSLE